MSTKKDFKDLNWKLVYPPEKEQVCATYRGLWLSAHEAGSWWVYVERNGAVLHRIADADTHGGMGANMEEAKALAFNAAVEYLKQYPHLS